MIAVPIVLAGISVVPILIIQRLRRSPTTGPAREFILSFSLLGLFGFISQRIIIRSDTIPASSPTTRFMSLVAFPLLLYVTAVIISQPDRTVIQTHHEPTDSDQDTIPIHDSVTTIPIHDE